MRTSRTRTLRIHTLHWIAPLALMVIGACGGSSDGPAGPGGPETQTATATVTPANFSITRSGSVNITVVHSAIGGLVLGGGGTINRPLPGILITETSEQKTSSLITRVYNISADASVPLGEYRIFFSVPVSGYTGMGTSPSSSVGFTLTLTQ